MREPTENEIENTEAMGAGLSADAALSASEPETDGDDAEGDDAEEIEGDDEDESEED